MCWVEQAVILKSDFGLGNSLESSKRWNYVTCKSVCVSVCLQIHVHMQRCIIIYTHIHARTNVCIYIKIHKHINISVHMCVCIYKQGSLSYSLWLVYDSLWNFPWRNCFLSHQLFSKLKVFAGRTQSPFRFGCVSPLTCMGRDEIFNAKVKTIPGALLGWSPCIGVGESTCHGTEKGKMTWQDCTGEQ